MGKRKYVDISGLNRASLLQAFYQYAGSAGLGLIEMMRDGLEGKAFDLAREEAEQILDSSRGCNGIWIDYLHGRRLKLFFSDRHPNRLNIFEYEECSIKKAIDIVADLRKEAGDV